MAEDKEAIYDMLENTTVKVIYHSCLAEPKTLSDVASIWDYQSPNYFYQKNQRKLIGEMSELGLISYSLSHRGDIISNIDIMFEEYNVKSFFNEINVQITNNIIDNKYENKFSDQVLNDITFLQYLISKEEGLKELLSKTMFNESDIGTMMDLFKNDVFRMIFLDAFFIKSIFNKRENLPNNLLNFLYDLLITLCDDYNSIIYERGEDFVDEGEIGNVVSFMPLSYNYLFLDNENYHYLYENYNKKKYDDDDYDNMLNNLNKLYNILKRKAEVLFEEEIEEKPYLYNFMEVFTKNKKLGIEI